MNVSTLTKDGNFKAKEMKETIDDRANPKAVTQNKETQVKKEKKDIKKEGTTDVKENNIGEIKKEIEKYRENLVKKRNWNVFFCLLPIILGLTCSALFTWAIMRRSEVVGYGWWVKLFLCCIIFISLIAVCYFSYLLVKNFNRYTAAITRLDVLIVRIGLKDMGDLLMTNIGRELQMTAKML